MCADQHDFKAQASRLCFIFKSNSCNNKIIFSNLYLQVNLHIFTAVQRERLN